jgi:hypothetical protein
MLKQAVMALFEIYPGMWQVRLRKTRETLHHSRCPS